MNPDEKSSAVQRLFKLQGDLFCLKAAGSHCKSLIMIYAADKCLEEVNAAIDELNPKPDPPQI